VKFRCDRDELADALQSAARAVGARASLPVLNGIRLELSGSTLQVTGSDLDLWITASLEVGDAEAGMGVVPARLLTDSVRSLPPGRVEISIADDEATIRSERVEFSLRTTPAAEYPKLPEMAPSSVTVSADALVSAVRQVVAAASTDDARPILRGVQMEAEGDGVRLVATDSYRLAVRDLPGTSLLEPGQSVLVPRPAFQELGKLMADEESVTLHLGERDATFQVGSATLTTRLIEGDFPNYRTLIPQQHPHQLSIGRDALIEAVKRVKVVARDAAATPVRLTMKPGLLELSATTQDYGTAFEQLDARYDGPELTVAFNPEYLVAGAEVADGDEITLDVIDALKPALLQAPGSPDYRYVLMPVRSP
jgi:DNA polymerase-3 subunit beta